VRRRRRCTAPRRRLRRRQQVSCAWQRARGARREGGGGTQRRRKIPGIFRVAEMPLRGGVRRDRLLPQQGARQGRHKPATDVSAPALAARASCTRASRAGSTLSGRRVGAERLGDDVISSRSGNFPECNEAPCGATIAQHAWLGRPWCVVPRAEMGRVETCDGCRRVAAAEDGQQPQWERMQGVCWPAPPS